MSELKRKLRLEPHKDSNKIIAGDLLYFCYMVNNNLK